MAHACATVQVFPDFWEVFAKFASSPPEGTCRDMDDVQPTNPMHHTTRQPGAMRRWPGQTGSLATLACPALIRLPSPSGPLHTGWACWAASSGCLGVGGNAVFCPAALCLISCVPPVVPHANVGARVQGSTPGAIGG
eukprot:CAMPEP_0174281494 /NCGR_PEP_ID=MMETSP0809-20121228/1890_1 /TAXON_ID=73025 ORGANISM="Eutreptiella gymnastica-like, Strain CCMP1594" /NCGR_SAMPLE_ID=MMETSP0809 /ASSEMBLY_ACC=CAM_ASM_000658 /LENGTH=136 /DNA_ID=CAMNT_0015375095 /DNA_START=1092 /DNA_END=1503 /DNA_ORIENTATION=+